MSAADTIRSRDDKLSEILKDLLEGLIFGDDFVNPDNDDNTFYFKGISNKTDEDGYEILEKYKLGNGMILTLENLSRYEQLLMELLDPILNNNVYVEEIGGDKLYDIPRFITNMMLVPEMDTGERVVDKIVKKEIFPICGDYEKFKKKILKLEKDFYDKGQRLIFEGIFVFYKMRIVDEEYKYDIVILDGKDINNILRKEEKSFIRKAGENIISMAVSTFASGYGVIPGIIAPKFTGILVSKAIDMVKLNSYFSSSSVNIVNRVILKLYVFICEYIHNLFELNDVERLIFKTLMDSDSGTSKEIPSKYKSRVEKIKNNMLKMLENIDILKNEILKEELDEFYNIPLMIEGGINYYEKTKPVVSSNLYPIPMVDGQDRRGLEKGLKKIESTRRMVNEEIKNAIPSSLRSTNFMLNRERANRLAIKDMETRDKLKPSDKIGVVLLPVKKEIPSTTIVTGTGYDFREMREKDDAEDLSLRRLGSEVETEKEYEYFLVQAIYSKYPSFDLDMEELYKNTNLKKIDIHGEITMYLESLMNDDEKYKDILKFVEIYKLGDGFVFDKVSKRGRKNVVSEGRMGKEIYPDFIPIEIEKYGLGNIFEKYGIGNVKTDGKLRILNNVNLYLPESTEFIKLYKYDKYGRNIGLNGSDKEYVNRILSEYENVGDYINNYYMSEFGPMTGKIEPGNGLIANLIYNNYKILEPAYRESIIKLADEEGIDLGSIGEYDVDVRTSVPMNKLMEALYNETTGEIDETRSNRVFSKTKDFISNLLSYRDPSRSYLEQIPEMFADWWRGDTLDTTASQLERDLEFTPSQTMNIYSVESDEDEYEAAAAPAPAAAPAAPAETDEVRIDMEEEEEAAPAPTAADEVRIDMEEEEEASAEKDGDILGKRDRSDEDSEGERKKMKVGENEANMAGGGLSVIINPITGEQHNIGSITGQNIIKKYLKQLNN